MRITSSTYAAALLTLPWDIPLEHWGEDITVALPRGISRHVVRFIRLDRSIVAVKEIGVRTAHHEYKMLKKLQSLGAPSVAPVAVITGRQPANPDYGELTAALVTEHLEFSLPYRAVFSSSLSEQEAKKLIGAISMLLVRLHLLNFFWGDVSLSNTLFRRDAETYSAYLVDAETGEFQPNLSTARRLYDVEIARVNVIGELMDLQSGGYMRTDIDVINLGSVLENHYLELWHALTDEEDLNTAEYWKVNQRIETLNSLGFDVGELNVDRDRQGGLITIKPVIVEPGHHHRQLLGLTGLSVEEHQAQRLLNAIRAYRATNFSNNVSLEYAAHEWLRKEYEAAIAAIPEGFRGKLAPAQVYHEIADHRWFLAEEKHEAIPFAEATRSYLENVLPQRRDEARLFEDE